MTNQKYAAFTRPSHAATRVDSFLAHEAAIGGFSCPEVRTGGAGLMVWDMVHALAQDRPMRDRDLEHRVVSPQLNVALSDVDPPWA